MLLDRGRGVFDDMIDCPFRTMTGCKIIDAGVGLPIIVDESACEFCIKENPQPETRHASYPVRNITVSERTRRGIEVRPTPQHSKYKVAQPASVVNREKPPARDIPIVAEPAARLEICEDCSSWVDERCKACTSCSKRPRPLAETGSDCPLGLWRRG